MSSQSKLPEHQDSKGDRLPYTPPAFETEQLFEITGLGCGKCQGGEAGGQPDQPACDSFDGLS